MTKAEREAEALQRRKEEVERKQKELKDLEKQRNKFLSDARKSDRDRRDRDYRRDRDRRSRSRSRTRSKEREERRNERIAEKDKERMQEAIKTRYLGNFYFLGTEKFCQNFYFWLGQGRVLDKHVATKDGMGSVRKSQIGGFLNFLRIGSDRKKVRFSVPFPVSYASGFRNSCYCFLKRVNVNLVFTIKF